MSCVRKEGLDTTTLKPGVGAGDVKLRSAPNDIVAQLGEPERKDERDNEEIWNYPSARINVVFEREGTGRFVSAIESRDPDARVANTSVIGRSKEELSVLYHIRGFGQPAFETDGIVEDLTFAEAGLVLSFFEGKVEEVTVALPASLAAKTREHVFAAPKPAATVKKSGCLGAILGFFTLG